MSVKSSDLVLITFSHNWDAETSEGYLAEDILSVTIVHRPRTYSYWDSYRDERKTEVNMDPECGSETPTEHQVQIVPRKFVNMRNVRKCQRVSCFGGSK